MNEPDRPDRVEHRAEHTRELPAAPEQVWDAIATAEGISAWMVPTRLDRRTVAGSGTVPFGPDEQAPWLDSLVRHLNATAAGGEGRDR